MVVQTSEVFVSDVDLKPGEEWFSAIRKALGSSAVGLVIVTPENKDEAWLNYEAGGMAYIGNADETTCLPVLLGIPKGKLTGPLWGINHVDATDKDSFAQVIDRLILGGGNAQGIKKAYEMFWPQLEEKVNEILAEPPTGDAALPDQEDQIAALREEVRELHQLITRQFTMFPTYSASNPSIVTGLGGVYTRSLSGPEPAPLLPPLKPRAESIESRVGRIVTRELDDQSALVSLGIPPIQYEMNIEAKADGRLSIAILASTSNSIPVPRESVEELASKLAERVGFMFRVPARVTVMIEGALGSDTFEPTE